MGDEIQQQLDQLELSKEEAQGHIDKMRLLHRLTQNKDFKDLIEKDLFEKEPVRLVMLKAAPGMQNEESQSIINQQIDSIGFLRQYFITINQMGRSAERSMADFDTAQEELLAEQLTGTEG